MDYSFYAESVSNNVFSACEAIKDLAEYYQSPSVTYRPKISVDGDEWCALYGDNLQDGVAGFGNSPYEAMKDFDTNWFVKLKP